MPADPTLTITLTVKFDKDGDRNIRNAPVRAVTQRAVDVATEALTQGLTRDGVTTRVSSTTSRALVATLVLDTPSACVAVWCMRVMHGPDE